MNPAVVVIAVCGSALVGLVAVALRAGGLLTRRVCAVGLLLHGVIVTAIVVGAYAGTLPDWFRGRDVPHYDTFMHFHLVGLLAFFLEGALAPRPFRIAGLPWSRVGLAILAISAFEELVIQPRFPNRGSSFHDALGNGSGVLLLSALALRTRRAGTGAGRV